MADLAIGVTAIASFWCSLPFKAAAVWASAVFLLGDAVGHVHQMLILGNFCVRQCWRPVRYGRHMPGAVHRSVSGGMAVSSGGADATAEPLDRRDTKRPPQRRPCGGHINS